MDTGIQDLTDLATTRLRQKYRGQAIERTHIRDVVQECNDKLLDGAVAKDDVEQVIADLESRMIIAVGKATTLSDNTDHRDWYFGERKQNRPFFERYRRFLLEEQHWPEKVVDAIDETTDDIMELLEDPGREGPWGRRGLVVGDVQSGKTANYAALANKSADAGYKLIIVMAGMHNALRQQTQIRLDRDVLGYDTTPLSRGRPFTRIGVSMFDHRPQAEHLTTQEPNGDFRRAFADNLGMGVQQRPVLMVVKKNASILRNLNNWVSEVLTPRRDTMNRPLLLIDDEADQASIDTGEQDYDEDDIPDPDYEPTRINGQIRQLLSQFERSAYVAYTATPFANVLIHDAAEADTFGRDLFPRSFIINLPTPDNYVGARRIFGIQNYDGDAGEMDVIRLIDQQAEGWLATGHKKYASPRFDGQARIPPSLEDAMLTFFLACAARRARGHTTAHNSMLIHVSRFKDVHARVFSQVEHWLKTHSPILRYGIGDDELLRRMEALWRNDFEPTTAQIQHMPPGRGVEPLRWEQVREHLADAIERIRPQVVNGDMKEALDYDRYPDGLNVIAIGGDKLSRGLTLEGLTVSYFLRASRMYDSLMQMGRWFGYRPGYADLCRVSMTEDLRLWFRHVAAASDELRDRLDHMAMIGATPEQYGLRVQSHPILMVTAQNKMRHAREFQVSFAGESKIQTVFYREEKPNRANATAIVETLLSFGPMPADEQDVRRIAGLRKWTSIPGTDVANLLARIEFPDEARDVNAERLSSFIREQISAGELTSWTVAVPSGQGNEMEFQGWTFKTVDRAPLKRRGGTPSATRFTTRTILDPRHEALDLSDEEVAVALRLTNEKRSRAGRPTTKRPDGPEIRQVRGRNPRRGLLLLYPLSPFVAEVGLDFPLFGVVVSFPDSANGLTVRYRFNRVAERFERA